MEKTAEVDFLRRHLPTLEREVEFWENKRSIMVSEKVFVQNSSTVPKRPKFKFCAKIANFLLNVSTIVIS